MIKKTTNTKKATKSTAPADMFEKQAEVLQKKFGDGVIETLNSVQERPINRCSSGSLALDYLISPKLGGMRSGRLLQLWGPPGCGKTTLAMQFVANAMETTGKRSVIIDAERTLDPSIALSAGVDPARCTLLKLRTEEAINSLVSFLKTGEVGAVVIDSLSALKPSLASDKEVDVTKRQVAYHANFISRWIDEVADLCADHDVLLIIINQVRNQLGTYMGGTKPASGGYSYDHAVSVSLKLTGSVKSSSARILDSTGRPVGQFVTCKCDKSKIDMPQKEVRIPLFLGLGVNPFMELAELAVSQTGVITAKGAYYYMTDDMDSGNIAQGMNALVNRLRQDNEFFVEVRDKVIEELELKYPQGAPFLNPFLNSDLTPKDVEYNRVDETKDKEPAEE
jgi:recombination protein RecA